MSVGFDQRAENNLLTNTNSVEAHRETYRHFLLRHEQEAGTAVREGRDGLSEITSRLLQRVSDPRNIRVAMDRVIENGGVPGPDGLDLADLTNSEKWQLARTVNQCLLEGQYRHGPTRQAKIKKVSGNGYRTIHVENQIDRAVSRSALQIIQPVIDPQLSDNSFGFRPGKDRRHALLAALQQLGQGRHYWVIADLKDAFDNIPVSRLLDVLRKMLPGIDDQTTGLISEIVTSEKKRGIRQGNSLSPLMLNIYLHQLLDRVWAKLCPDEPLLRTADDILIRCRTAERAHAALELLRQILRPTGMKLNDKKSTIRDLQEEHSGADWLGYHISLAEGKPRVRIAESAWGSLGGKLEECHRKVGSPLRAYQSVLGWLDQMGPAYAEEDLKATYLRLREMSDSLAFDEMPDEEECLSRWQSAYQRWRLLSRLSLQDTSGGSACQSFFPATRDRRGDGASRGAPSLSLPADVPITLHTDGSCDRLTSCGGWVAILEWPGCSFPVRRSGLLSRTTNNRAELTAVIQGLERTPERATVRVVSDSEYVVRGVNEWLTKWKSQGWCAGSKRHKRPLQNLDLWQRLDGLLDARHVTADWVRGHSGHSRNEECDVLAFNAMKSAASR